jgi:hypothetical protein
MFAKFGDLMCRNGWLAALGAVSMLDAVFVISGLAGTTLWSHWLVSENPRKLTGLGIAHVVAWTVLPPLWFFLETFIIEDRFLPRPAHSTDAELKAGYDRLRVAQDLAAKVWAAVLAAILFLVPK